MELMAVIGGAFLLTLISALVTRVSPIVYAWLIPLIATVAVVVAISLWPQSSTDGVVVPFILLFTALGSVPGAHAAAWIKRERSDRS